MITDKDVVREGAHWAEDQVWGILRSERGRPQQDNPSLLPHIFKVVEK